MAKDEAKVRVKLDTTQAKRDLRGLAKQGQATSGRISKGVRGALGRGFGALGVGAAVGVGIAAVRGPTAGGIGDVVGEAFGGIGAQLSRLLLGDLKPEALADKFARDQTRQAFGQSEAMARSPGAKSYFDNIRAIQLDREKGALVFEEDTRFRSTNAKDLVDRIMAGLGKLIWDATTRLGEILNPFDGK